MFVKNPANKEKKIINRCITDINEYADIKQFFKCLYFYLIKFKNTFWQIKNVNLIQ